MRQLCCAVLLLLAVCAVVAQGVDQRPGIDATMGKDFTFSKDAPLQFRLVSLEYRATRAKIGNSLFAPTRDEKVLIVHFSVQNRTKEEQNLCWNTINFTAVDSDGNNHEDVKEIADEKLQQSLDIMLKPAQRLDCYTVIVLAAQGGISKLIVLPDNETELVLRYDLTPGNKAKHTVKPLALPYIAATDKVGQDALAEIPAQMGKEAWYALGDFDFRLDAVTYSTAAITDETLEEGERWCWVSGTAKNMAPEERNFCWATIEYTLILDDDAEADSNKEVYPLTSLRTIETDLKPGAEKQFRRYFRVPKDAKVKTLSVAANQTHSLTYDISATQ